MFGDFNVMAHLTRNQQIFPWQFLRTGAHKAAPAAGRSILCYLAAAGETVGPSTLSRATKTKTSTAKAIAEPCDLLPVPSAALSRACLCMHATSGCRINCAPTDLVT